MKSNELSKSFEQKVGQTIFVVEAKNLAKGKVSAEEKLKNIMIRICWPMITRWLR
jgi:hypothetical protein